MRGGSSTSTARSARRPRRRSRSWWGAGRTPRWRALDGSGDGWLALWVSPRRFEDAAGRIEAAAAEGGRIRVVWQHALQLWAGFDESRAKARERVSTAMEAAYALPFDRFERYTPCGPPAAIAEALAPYLAARLPVLQLRPRGGEPSGGDGGRI